MSVNQQLYKELYDLRQRFKIKGKYQSGRAPLVCNDEALYAIAEMCPKKIEDLRGIPGIGNTFIDNYGEAFIEVVKKYVVTKNEATINLGTTAEGALKELEKKLVSINRRNRLLYMPKLANKYGCDLSQVRSSEIIELLMNQSGALKICDLSQTSSDASLGRLYKSIVSLSREINKDLRDKGQNDLYIGYPFVIGRLPGENFDVRCPLVLFPVEIERTPTTITISYDDTRDALFNNVLLLAYFKFNNIKKPLPQAVVEEDNISDFNSYVIKFYEDNGIQIKSGNDRIDKFKEYAASEFPHFNEGELQIQRNLVIGKFPVRSSSIQKDFDSIIENGEINNLLNELLLEINDLDYESDAYYGDKAEKEDKSTYTVSEKSITYINNLDGSQENVLSAIRNIDKLVIQGPPGTGKSQTITSLIAEFVNDGKTVLMVSEKKTALDVVYSRLGELSNYTLLIDDVGNKDLFYQQLEKMIYLGRNQRSNYDDLSRVSAEVDNQIIKLEQIAQKLYQSDSFGIEPYKVYRENRRIDFTDQASMNRVLQIHNRITATIMGVPYGTLNEIRRRFASIELCEKLVYYNNLLSAEEWISKTKSNLSEFDLLGFNNDLVVFEEQLKEYNSKNCIVRLFKRGKIKSGAKHLCQLVIDVPTKENVQLAIKRLDHFREVMSQYLQFDQIRPLYNQLSSVELDYLRLIQFASQFYNNDYALTNDEVYNQILQEHISLFETQNRQLLQYISDYNQIIRILSDAISEKKRMTKEHLKNMLADSMSSIANAKRTGEMQRIIESKRKWSVNRFLSKYSFEMFNGVKIWLLTPEVVSEIIPLDTGIFDLVIFDEASQMYIEKGLPSVYRAKKVVVAGDHKQLRPSSLGVGRIEIDEDEVSEDTDVPAALEEESLLDLARFKYQNVMLNFHYRAKYEELIAFSNYAFYHGRLNVSPNVDKPDKPPIEFHMMSDAMWINRSNLPEAKYIVAMLRDILRDRKSNETIGIITFNSSQRDLIEDLLDEQCALDSEFASAVRAEVDRKENGEDIGLFIKNIESVQGDERDIIIFSIGYAKNENGRLIRSFGWLNQKGGENRLNVAISRAKKKIHIVTSFIPEELQVEDTKNEGPKILKKYLQYAKAVSDEDQETQRQILLSFGDDSSPGSDVIFDSDFELQVYDALNYGLRDKGFTIDTQVGIGGYSIDLALKYEGKYILGIECDGKMYHSSKSARERDYHRQKYLESRGWRIHRIWSTNWWKNSQGEIKKICDLAESLIC